MSVSPHLQNCCEELRSLHVQGDPLLLPNAWDVATARAVVAAGFPVVATTSWGVALSLGFEDDERAPADEMIAAAARIARGVDVPVTVDFEAGYGMDPAAVVAALMDVGAAGCNLEDTDNAAGVLHDPADRAAWFAAVREAATAVDYPLVLNARVDPFLVPYVTGADPRRQIDLVPDAIERANAYLDAGADCVYPVALWEPAAVRRFLAEVDGPVNLSVVPEIESVERLADLGVARLSWAIFLYEAAMARFGEEVASLRR